MYSRLLWLDGINVLGGRVYLIDKNNDRYIYKVFLENEEGNYSLKYHVWDGNNWLYNGDNLKTASDIYLKERKE